MLISSEEMPGQGEARREKRNRRAATSKAGERRANGETSSLVKVKIRGRHDKSLVKVVEESTEGVARGEPDPPLHYLSPRYLHSTEFSSFLKSSDYHPQRTVKVLVEEQAIQELQEVGVSVGENVGVLKRPDGESPSSCSYPTSTNTINPPPGIDLIITLGGDGTILHLSSLYSTAGAVPPVLSFSMGSLGFLLPFHIEHYRETLKDVFQGTYGVLHRMRLACQVFSSSGEVVDRCSGAGSGWQVMNEVALHRGRYPHLSVVDAFVNGQHLTEAVADGLILATPTGSTAYSLSSGGPIAHPSINSFLLTPIAPRSLSFRTLLLPDNCEVKMQISHKSRASSELSMDGREVCILHPGEYITLRKSAFPIPCIVPKDGKDGWVADIK
ncbi:hypothetical protein QFC21_004987 [Naganishia friedmannii]|uniref:Uncharacterized protein n=1 Tax=Naganishia friedmannii TaxID=89922 RepID=A0ACC2VCP7_9TREE|nr:hypothetical protein QFC21_004987 [Naganishia friedmannii]